VGTDGYKIITAAGLKPWPEFTEQQREVLAARDRAKERERQVSEGLPHVGNTDGIAY
jgi:hypothetical protein